MTGTAGARRFPPARYSARVPDVGDHYFTAEPASGDERRTVEVELAGRVLEVETARGVFSPGRVDPGTRVLLRHAGTPPTSGDLLDLGCGWGPVALTLAVRAPGARVWAVDVNRRALDLLRRTADRAGLAGIRPVSPDQVPDDVRYAAIWSNPPIRVGKPVLHDLMRTWLGRLAPDGAAHLVVQRNLGADTLHRWITEELGMPTERVASSKGYRVLRVTPPPG